MNLLEKNDGRKFYKNFISEPFFILRHSPAYKSHQTLGTSNKQRGTTTIYRKKSETVPSRQFKGAGRGCRVRGGACKCEPTFMGDALLDDISYDPCCPGTLPEFNPYYIFTESVKRS